MPHRRELSGIANGLAGSFASRNNDHRGYWALGFLYAHALRHDARVVRLDLVSRQLAPQSSELVPITNRYADRLERLIDKAGFNRQWVRSAEIIVEFRSSESHEQRARRTYGDPYVCRVSLQDDRGKTYEAIVVGHAAPHDPARESRRQAHHWG